MSLVMTSVINNFDCVIQLYIYILILVDFMSVFTALQK